MVVHTALLAISEFTLSIRTATVYCANLEILKDQLQRGFAYREFVRQTEVGKQPLPVGVSS